MAQVKIYGLRPTLLARKEALSDAIHEALVEAFAIPKDKRFQRFVSFEQGEFLFPADRTENYTIVEISVFEGRSLETKKALINTLFARVSALAGVSPQDLEITIFETPRANWGIRGKPGDELTLNYKVDV